MCFDKQWLYDQILNSTNDNSFAITTVNARGQFESGKSDLELRAFFNDPERENRDHREENRRENREGDPFEQERANEELRRLIVQARNINKEVTTRLEAQEVVGNLSNFERDDNGSIRKNAWNALPPARQIKNELNTWLESFPNDADFRR